MAVEAATDFDPVKAVASCARSVASAVVENPEDALKLLALQQQFLQAVATILDMGENEMGDALGFYEKTQGKQPRRPKRVTKPMQHAAQLVRFAAGRYPKAARELRSIYAEDRAKKRSSSGGRKFSMT